MLSINKDIDTLNRTLASIGTLIGIIMLFLVNYSLYLVPKQAHWPYNKLNSIIERKPLPIILKLKVLGLIEKLSGPVIGIYCFDLFPYTNHEFYLYIGNCFQNFLLLNGLFGK